FDVNVGMDWLSKRKFAKVCHEKVVRIPLEGDEILRVHGERTQGVVKTLKNAKVDELKLSDISVVQDFIDVFPEDLSMTTGMTRLFEILERIGLVADRLRLPEELSCIKVDKTLRFVEEPVENSDREVKRLKCSRMVVVKAKLLAVRYLVKVSWNSKCNFELTWVWEDYLKDKYPRLIVWLVKLLVLTYVSVAMNGLCVIGVYACLYVFMWDM
ncbi:hypothetical protein Tco_1111327, partial [Tanacetum coccineum]